MLEGLYAEQKISRTDEWQYRAAEEKRRAPQTAEQFFESELQMPRPGKGKKNYYN